MLYLVKTTLQYCKSQELAWDPKKDLNFLCRNYASEIQKIRQQLNQKEIQDMYLSTSYFAKLSPDDQRKSYNVLLDKDPPPLMSITPPPPQLGQKLLNSAPGNSLKPPLLSHKSSPALSTGAQPPSKFLSPPKPGKPKSRPAQPPLNALANQATPTGPHAQMVPIYSTTSDSRSRYRATSAPNAPNAGVNKSSQLAAPASSSRPMSMDSRGSQQQANPGFYSTARAVGVQNGPNFSRPQVVQVQPNAHAAQSAQSMGPALQKSMPNLKPSPTAQVPLPTSSHKIIPPGPRASYIPPQSASSAIPPASIPGARGMEPKSPPPQHAFQGTPHGQHVNDRARLSNSSGAFLSKTAPVLAHGNMPLSNQRPQQQHNRSVLSGALNSNPPSVESSSAPAAGLRLVGPEGVYSSPTKANQAKRSPPTGALSNAGNPHTASGPVSRPPVSTQATFAFELDASPGQPIARSLPPQELPTNLIMSKLMHSSAPQAPSIAQGPQQMQNHTSSKPQLAAPPEFAHLAHDVVPPLSPPINAVSQSSIPHNELFPTDNIPMSLMAGGAARQRSPNRSPHQSPQRTPQHSPQPSQNMQTNASRYTRYFSPSSSPNNGQMQPYTAPVSEYKAYSGSASPPVSATATGILQKVQTFGAPLPTVATAQGPIYAAPDVQQAQYSFPNSSSHAGNPTPPISPPESRDSHQFPANQNVYAGSKDHNNVMGAPGYTQFSYRTSGELHLSGKSQTPSQTQMQPEFQAQMQNQHQVQMNTQLQQQARIQNEQQQQQHQYPQLEHHVQMNTQPQQQARIQDEQHQHQQQQQHQYPQPQHLTQITNDQLVTPAPLQWTHPALQNSNYVHPESQPQRQYQPQPNIYTQPPHIQPLSHSNVQAYDSPTTPQHARNTSHDSDKLAQEYQSELPVFGEMGYGSGKLEQGEFAKNESEGSVQRSDSGRPQDAWRQSGGKREEKRISEVYEFIDFT